MPVKPSEKEEECLVRHSKTLGIGVNTAYAWQTPQRQNVKIGLIPFSFLASFREVWEKKKYLRESASLW